MTIAEKVKYKLSNNGQSYWTVKKAYIWILIVTLGISFISTFSISKEKIEHQIEVNTKDIVFLKDDNISFKLFAKVIDTKLDNINNSIDELKEEVRYGRRNK